MMQKNEEEKEGQGEEEMYKVCLELSIETMKHLPQIPNFFSSPWV